MQSSRTILFVGGGSLGHVVPSLAVAQEMRHLDPSVRPVFVCADRADEKAMIGRAGHAFHTVSASKFLLSPKLLLFPATFLASCLRAHAILQEEKPAAVFSKAGFVSLPLCIVAWWKNIPIVHHESDSVIGHASRCIARMATLICCGFPDVVWPRPVQHTVVTTGNPVRREISEGSEAAGQRITGFSGKRPALMILGGSQGSDALNQAVSDSQRALLELADIIHLSGVGKKIGTSHARYFVRPTVGEELPHLYALADIVLSRAGAGVLSELAVLKKTVIVVPLSGVAHDHQVRNAEVLENRGAVEYLRQENLKELPDVVRRLLKDPERSRSLGHALHAFFPSDAAKKIAALTLAEAKKHPLES